MSEPIKTTFVKGKVLFKLDPDNPYGIITKDGQKIDLNPEDPPKRKGKR